MIKAIRDGSLQITQLAATVVANAAEVIGIHRLLLKQVCNGIGQLDFATGTPACRLELVEDLGCQQVGAHDCEV